jgi:hypothetical protein
MKNIHLIPTSKPSRLLYSGNNKNLLFSKEPISFRTFERSPQNIYITSNEEIKEGIDQWYLDKVLNEPYTSGGAQYSSKQDVIILTTDQDLIKDGVQAIDDEFLEWFVNNPSCEFVEVEKLEDSQYVDWLVDGSVIVGIYENYEIIIPKEEHPKQIKCYCGHTSYCDCSPLDEPKQETLEEAAVKYKDLKLPDDLYDGFIEGAKWQAERMGLMEIELRHTKTLLASCEKALEDRDKQAERMYSEEEVESLLHRFMQSQHPDWHGYSTTKWFEQFKKK